MCGPLNFVVENGDRIALSGKNGSGKSSVLKLAIGEPITHTGSFFAGQGLKISYLPQSVDFLKGSLRDYALQRDIDESLLKTILRKPGFGKNAARKGYVGIFGGTKEKSRFGGLSLRKGASVCLGRAVELCGRFEPYPA